MRDIVFRYLFAEVARTWLTVAGVLMFLTLGLSLARFLGDAVAGELPVFAVLELATLGAVENLEIVLPVSMLLAVLLTLGRLCRDNELAALLAGGIGLRRLYRPFLVLALLVAFGGAVLSLFAAPRAEQAIETLGAASASSMVASLSPGRFRTFLDGDAVFYAQSRDADGNLSQVFIRVVRDGDNGKPRQTVVTAERARQHMDPDTGRVTLVLDDGWRYEGVPGQADYRVIRFREHGVQLAPPQPEPSADVDMLPLAALWATDTPEAAAEWQVRLSVPLSILILTLLALPIGRVPPRSGRYARVIVGILLYVIYVNAIHLATVGVEEGRLPAALGVWWVHGLVMVIAVALVLREQGFFVRRRRGTMA